MTPRSSRNPRVRPSRWLMSVGICAALVGLGGAQAQAAEPPTVSEPIPTGNSPYEIGVLPGLHKAFVAENADGAVSVLNTETNEFTYPISLGGKSPLSVSTNKATNKVYVGTYQDTLEVIDGETGTVEKTYQVGKHAHSIGVDENSGKVAVANGLSNTVTIIDKTGWAVSVNVGELPTSPVFSADGQKLYVTNAQSNSVSVIGTGPEAYWPKVEKTIGTESWPLQAALNPATNKLYVSNNKQGTVQVIDGATDNVVGSIPVGVEPIDIAVNEATNSVYVANSKSDTVSTIDGASQSVRATTSTNGHYPMALAVQDEKTAYLVNRASNNLNVLTDPGATQ